MISWIAGQAERIHLAIGGKRALIAFLSGACGALALAPVNFFPAMVLPACVAIWLIDGCGGANGFREGLRRARSAAAAGWFWGFGYFVAGLFWLGAAFFVEADKFAWAAPLGVFGLPAVLALFPAFGFALAALLWRPGWRRIFAFAFGLSLAELARGALFTGFPWNAPGMALGDILPLAQIASIVGLDGLTFLTLLLSAAPATLVDGPGKFRLRSPTGAALVTFIGLGVFGFARLAEKPPADAPNVRLRILQPNLPQNEKFRPSAGMDILRDYLALSDRSTSPQTPGLSAATLLIWPESPLPFALAREPQALGAISQALAGRTTLLTGAIRLDGEGPRANAYNSISVISPAGEIIESYDKNHLVPFGEYLPFSNLLRALGLRQFIAFPGGFDAGRGRRPLNAPGAPAFLPLICYEAIFPYETASSLEAARIRPSWILNVTNDAWFGKTPGPWQHLAQARLRAIETGLPLVRAANSGVSAVIDPYGRILRFLPLGTAGVLDSSLPGAIAPTLFAFYYRWPLAALLALSLAVALSGRRR